MKNMLLKDLYLTKKHLLYIVLFFLHTGVKLFWGNASLNKFIYYSMILFFNIILSISSLNESNSTINSLPVTRKEIILSKFIFFNINYIFIIAFLYILSNLMHYINTDLIVFTLNIKDLFSLMILSNFVFTIIIFLYNLYIMLFYFSLIFIFFLVKPSFLSDSISKLNNIAPLKVCVFLLFMCYLINKSVKLFKNIDIY
ncbi:hypothetical protein K144313037_06100 [Clostridium tetani]|nr:hypothetical protein C3B72_10735 [Clostridium tetani]RXI75962.1 hypothetical protein DP128_08300 [Clostridium tetani]SUY54804.1 Uncharacterised protein [Clostridium tetani]BDR69198.1 hypothetical protein K144313037_06100 [Clostridium tetani]BDR71893.1 hypothetical protein K144316041_06010 [Clostridium tetani]